MDPNSSLEKICLGDDVIVILSDKVKGSRDWNSPKYQDTAVSKGEKVMNAPNFYMMETYEIIERYITPCFMNGLEAFDGEVNLAFHENLISNEFAVKLCLDYEVKKGKKLVKKELIVALKGELYFVKFIINHKEDDFEPRVILGRSFLRLAQGVVDFGNGVITIYPEPNRFAEDSEKTRKSSDDWDQLLDFNFDDIPKSGEELPPFVCKMGKSNRNKKRAMEILNLFYQDIRPYSSSGRHITQEEAEKEELAIRISQRYLLEEERLNVKENEEAVKRIKGEALKEKDDPGAFIFPIILEGKEDMKKVDRGITMINHTQEKAMGKLSNVLCQVGVTTIIAKFLILDIPIDCDALIVVGQGFLHMMGSILNASEIIFSTFDGTSGTHDGEARSSRSKCPRQHETLEELLLPQVHHEFLLWEGCNRDAKSRIMAREAESEEEVFTLLAWIRAFNINEPIYAKLCHEVCADDELQSKKIIKFRLGGRAHSLTLLEFARRLGLYQAVELEEDGFNVYFEGGLRNDDNFNAQDYWLSISQEENLSLSRSHTSTIRNPILRVIHKMITYGLCQRTTGYDKVQKNDLWLLSMFDARHQNGYANVAWVIARWMKRKGAGTQKESQICCGQFISKLARKCRVLTEDVVRSLSAPIYCRDLDTTTLRDLIDSDGKLIPEDPQPGVPRVGIPRPPRASMQDLYDRMGRMEIRQDAIERMEYRQSYHWDRYHGVFEHMAGVYSVPL
ncbi:hypothetical protein Tco_0385713 [Tanacetum coccineum]